MLDVGGFVPLSTTDWPGRLCAVAFVQGCPWRCVYCHNVSLQPRRGAGESLWPRVMATLRRRVGLLDGVVFSGGEPTLDAGLPAAIDEVRALGYGVGLHTAGIYPARLDRLLPRLDWVGFDLTADLAGYEHVTAARGSGAAVARSLSRLLDTDVRLEVRTTYHPAWLPDAALLALAKLLASSSVATWVLQRFESRGGAPQTLAGNWRWPTPAVLDAARDAGVAIALR